MAENEENAGQDGVSREVERLKPNEKMRKTRAALAMRVKGANDAEIAQMLGYPTPGHARMAWEGALASTIDSDSDLKALRGLATARTEAGMKAHAQLAFSPYVADPNDPEGKRKIKNDDMIAHSAAYFRYMDRWIKLKGLDAPQVVALITPDAASFDEIVGKLAIAARGESAEEADIFEEDEDGNFTQVEEDPDAER